jgi:hypothetical protein
MVLLPETIQFLAELLEGKIKSDYLIWTLSVP